MKNLILICRGYRTCNSNEDYGVVAAEVKDACSMTYEVYTRDHGIMKGTYICTLDNYHQDPDVIDYATSGNPLQNTRSHNLIELVMDSIVCIRTWQTRSMIIV